MICIDFFEYVMISVYTYKNFGTQTSVSAWIVAMYF